jgi:hypothetical protein
MGRKELKSGDCLHILALTLINSWHTAEIISILLQVFVLIVMLGTEH